MNIRTVASITLASSAIAGTAMAGEAESIDALRAEIAALNGRVHELESSNAQLRGDSWVDETREAEVRSIVADVLADADSRTSTLQSGGMAGHNGGFYLQDANGNFRMNIKGQMQFRWIYSMQENSGGDDNVEGFENTRTRFSFGGHVVDPSWKYFIWAGWTGNGSSLLLDAWIQKDLGNGWSIKAGQFKLPTWQEWTVSETRQQFVERSVLDARFSQLYSQGVMGQYSSDNLRAYFAISDGLRSWNTGYNATGATGLGFDVSSEIAATARVEYLIQGDWKNYADFNSFKGDDATYVVGGGVHYQKDSAGGVVANRAEVVEFNLDGSFEFGGGNVFAGVVYRTIDDGNTVDRSELGVLVQGGYFLADDLELVARYEHGDLDGGGGAAGDDLSILTVGITKFWNQHGLKWTTDVGYALDPVDAAWGGGGRGFRGDAANEDGQLVIRSQLQLLF